MSVRSTINTIWMHRNCTHIIHRGSLFRNNGRATTNALPTIRGRLKLNSLVADQSTWREFSTRRTTRTNDPYDALRREEEVLREQDRRKRTMTVQPNIQTASDEPTENDSSDRMISSLDSECAVRPAVDVFEPIITMQNLQDDYNNFEPVPKARPFPEKSRRSKNNTEVQPSITISRTVRDSDFSHEVKNQDILVHGVDHAEPALNVRYTSQYQPHVALEIAFFEARDRMFKSLFRTQDLAQLRQIYKSEYNRATEILQFDDSAHLSERLKCWETSGDFRFVAEMLIGSCLTSISGALTTYSALRTAADMFNIRVTFLHLVYVLHRDVFEQNAELAKRLDNLVRELRDPSQWPDMPIKLDFVLLSMKRLDDAHLHELIHNIDTKYYDPGPYQCQFYTRLCLSKGWTEMAFRIFRKLKKEVLRTPQEEVVILILRLIKRDTVVNGPGGPNFRFLSELLQRGLVLNAAMCSCVIERALELDHPNVAWDLYHYLKASGHDIESRTYLLLLQHSYATGNEHTVNEIMSEMHAKKELFSNAPLLSCAMNIIRNVCFFHQKMETSECLSHLLALYDRAYTRAPLVRLGIVTEIGSRERQENLPEPDTYMLCFILWAYILCHRHVPSAMKIWEQIHQRIQKGDTAVVECMTMDFLYNAYILLYRRDAKTLPYALEMFQYMLEKRWCLPTERTWAIIILGFLQHEQHAEARQLMELMYAHGFTNESFDPSHFPLGVTMAGIKAVANTTHDEFLMPDGSDPLRGEIVREQGVDNEISGRSYNSVRRAPVPASTVKTAERDFDISMPLSRLVAT